MKKRNFKKLSLNKEAISTLQLKQITGGSSDGAPESMISCPGGFCDPPRPNTNIEV